MIFGSCYKKRQFFLTSVKSLPFRNEVEKSLLSKHEQLINIDRCIDHKSHTKSKTY